jgi:DNA-directed RNA polymerase subunit M/transcription elongation factor TFIIS
MLRGATYFLRECPTCGRKLQIRVEYLGKRVACRHCHAEFEATDPKMASRPSDSGSILERAEQLLAMDPPASVILRHSEF